MPYIVHRDELTASQPLKEGLQRYDLLGDRKSKLSDVTFDLVTLGPGEATNEHHHMGSEHYVFVLRGEGILVLGEGQKPIVQNYVISIDPEEEHAILNTGEEVLELLEFLIPVEG